MFLPFLNYLFIYLLQEDQDARTNELTCVLALGALEKLCSLQQDLHIFQESVDLVHVRVFGVEDVAEGTTRQVEILLLVRERRLGIKKELLALQTSLPLALGHFSLLAVF